MNHREPPHLRVGARRALHMLSLLLLPALAPKGADALPRGHRPLERGNPPTPYLPALGVPTLRFQEATPPPDLVTRPPAAAPPQPALSTTENSVAADNAAAVARSVPAAQEAEPTHPTAAKTTPKDTGTPPPPAILPDDGRPAIRPEDFLPYFQIPGTARHAGDVNLLVPVPGSAPAPAPLPPSSATYNLTK
jgi:hypothetical protein